MNKKDLAKIALSSVFSIGSLNVVSGNPTVHVDLKKRYVGKSNVDVVRIPTFSESLNVNFGSVGAVLCNAKKELVHG